MTLAARSSVRILLAASEVTGFAKTGGLADVAAALPRALRRLGYECAVITPLYRSAREATSRPEPTEQVFAIPLGHRTSAGRLWQSTLPGSDVPVYFVEHGEYFERDDPAHGRGLYQTTEPGGTKRDYHDNAERYTFFCRAVMELIPKLPLRPTVLHANDWQTGLLPVYLSEVYRRRSTYPYGTVGSVFTIHNIAYQGHFPPSTLQLTGLNPNLFNYRQLEFYGQLNFLKAGIVFADRLTTVSPSYAREIQTPYFAYGLQGILSERQNRLTGIVNGVEYGEWDPRSDPHIAAHYDADTWARGKAANKAALQKELGLPHEPTIPILGMVARLVEQKGIELVLRAADGLMAEGVQLVVLGEGDPHYHWMLEDLRHRHLNRVAIRLRFDEALAHKIEAGADIFLMPSLYEPSGLNQLYSLRYGTVPIVRATGGLADTITDASEQNLTDGTATGFRFSAHSPGAFLEAVQRALRLFRHEPDRWQALAITGMRQDWSWDRSAAAYAELYRELVAEKGGS